MKQEEQNPANAQAHYNEALGKYWLLRRAHADIVLPEECAEISFILKNAENALERQEWSQTAVAVEQANELLATVQAEYPAAQARRMQAAADLVASAERLVGLADPQSRKTAALGRKGVDPAYSLAMQARVALDFEDWHGAERRARGAIETWLRGRQAVLKPQPLFPASGRSPMDTLNPFNGAAQCRVIRLRELDRLVDIAAKQSIRVIKIAVLADAGVLRDLFSRLCVADSRLLNSEIIEAFPVMLLRVPIFRNLMMYVVGFPIDHYEEWSLRRRLGGFGRVMLYARDLSALTTHESQMALMCLSQVHKDQVRVAAFADEERATNVDSGLSQWISVHEIDYDRDKMVEFFRASVAAETVSKTGSGGTKQTVFQ